MDTEYNEKLAIFHNENGALIPVIVHDKLPGKNGFIGIIHPDNTHEFVEDWQITYGEHYSECEICEEYFNAN